MAIVSKEDGMENALRIVDGLSNVEAVSLLKELDERIRGSLDLPGLAKTAPAEIGMLGRLVGLGKQGAELALDPQASVDATRHILQAFARDPGLAPLLLDAWQKVQEDDSLLIGTAITIGLLVNLTLFMATSEMEIKVRGLTIRKGKADLEVLKAILEPVGTLIKKIPGVG